MDSAPTGFALKSAFLPNLKRRLTLFLPNVFLIGAFEKDSGKTSLCEKIISDFKETGIYAVKITVSRSDEQIERYSITEETEKNSKKDTGRYKLAGAVKVFWIRCNSFSSKKAITELFDMIPKDVMVVCESNTARKYLEPALFIMVRRDVPGVPKETAESVEKYADIITISSILNGQIVYEPDVTRLLYVEGGTWKNSSF